LFLFIHLSNYFVNKKLKIGALSSDYVLLIL